MATYRVLVTRAEEDAGALCDALRALGLEPVVVPLLARFPRPNAFEQIDWGAFDAWLLTSVAAVDAMIAAAAPADTRARIGAVGHRTAARAAAAGFRVSVVPPVATGAALVAAMGALTGATVLYPHAAEIESSAGEALRASGAAVTDVIAYDNAELPNAAERLRAAWPVDVVTLLSGSAARRFAKALGEAALPQAARVVVLGPSTEAAARACGLTVDAVASPQTVEAVAAAARRLT